MSFLIRDRNRTKPSFIITFTSLYHEAHNNQNVNKNYTTMNLARTMEGLMLRQMVRHLARLMVRHLAHPME